MVEPLRCLQQLINVKIFRSLSLTANLVMWKVILCFNGHIIQTHYKISSTLFEK